MKGYEKAPDGSKGAPLPSIASGESVEVITLYHIRINILVKISWWTDTS
jgi:hypothetical protein